jgi:hypothetical protein
MGQKLSLPPSPKPLRVLEHAFSSLDEFVRRSSASTGLIAWSSSNLTALQDRHRKLGHVLEDLFSDDESIEYASHCTSLASPSWEEVVLPPDVAAELLSNRCISSCVSVTESILDFRRIHGRTYQVCRTTEYW